MPADTKATMALTVAFAVLRSSYFVEAGAGIAWAGVAVEAEGVLIGTQGCT